MEANLGTLSPSNKALVRRSLNPLIMTAWYTVKHLTASGKGVAAILLLLGLTLPAVAAAACPESSLTADFPQRDALAAKAASGVTRDSWGPHAPAFTAPAVPAGCDAVSWKRERVLAAARHYIGLPYRHHHVPTWEGPDGVGLDCSNFTAWAYNYGLGVRFTGNVHKQADGPKAPGRRLAPDEPFQPGDLLFILRMNRSTVSHVVLYVDATTILDCHGQGVALRPFAGWYRSHLSHARRIIE